MSKFVLVLMVLCVSACSESPPGTSTGLSTDAEQIASSRAMAQWARSCALCHVNGEGGAPIVGDKQAWRSRLDQGEHILLTHTIEGYRNMPPLGYCMDCEEDDFRRIIRFMGGDS
jgi:cytochrome c5